MTMGHEEDLLRVAFAAARRLEPTEPEVARVVALTRSPRREHGQRPYFRRRGLVASGLASVLAVAVLTVPVTRAAIENAAGTVAETFSGYTRGNVEGAPGRPLADGDRAPEYFGDSFHGRPFARQPRVLAEAGGYKLFAYRAPSGSISFDLGNTGVGMGFSSAREIGPGALVILGPAAMQGVDPEGHVPLFGLAADSVSGVELVYESGPPQREAGVEGGFVLLASPARGPREVLALDAAGKVVGRQLVDDSPHHGPRIDWGQYLTP